MAKILIVEDEKAINDLIRFNLELVGHKCFQVFDGKAGLEMPKGHGGAHAPDEKIWIPGFFEAMRLLVQYVLATDEYLNK